MRRSVRRLVATILDLGYMAVDYVTCWPHRTLDWWPEQLHYCPYNRIGPVTDWVTEHSYFWTQAEK